jgi:hypothetical protein
MVHLSEFEGVLFPLQKLSISLQSDEPATARAAVVQAYMSYFEIALMKNTGVSCISLNGDDYTVVLPFENVRQAILYSANTCIQETNVFCSGMTRSHNNQPYSVFVCFEEKLQF